MAASTPIWTMSSGSMLVPSAAVPARSMALAAADELLSPREAGISLAVAMRAPSLSETPADASSLLAQVAASRPSTCAPVPLSARNSTVLGRSVSSNEASRRSATPHAPP
jgi:hypothetical protein